MQAPWPRRVVVAPDSFKGSASAREVAEAIARGLSRAMPGLSVETVPMADGGEGTVEALVEATGGRYVTETVTGPLGEPVEARFGMLGDGQTAVIEMAAASGLPLVPASRRNPLVTTTYGTGQLMRAALDAGATRILIGIGGSATVDGGAGMAQALGARLLDAEGHPIDFGGGALDRLARIDLSSIDPRLRSTTILVACDVRNPLVGPEGAAAVFGPQKGATPAMVRTLDDNLRHLAAVIRRDLGVDVAHLAGAGAAGGLGAGLVAFCGAHLQPGVELVIQAVGLERRLQGADLAVTGEGSLDRQTPFGKTPAGVGRLARRLGIPAIALVGAIGEGVDDAVLDACGLDSVFSIVPGPMPLDEAIRGAHRLLEQAAWRLGRWLSRRPPRTEVAAHELP
ncbi:MAG: glycerate kinase [Limnochordaceae bacterium]|nr:glycerate kinase [Limnochordaceae bacterium]